MKAEIRMRNAGWPQKPLGELLTFLTSGSRGWAEYYRETGDLFLRIQNVGKNQMMLDDVAFVDAPATAEAKRTLVQPGDVLLSITADLGRTGVVPEGIGKAYINQHLAILRVAGIHPPFLSAFLASSEGQKQVMGRNKHAVKAGLNFEDIRSFQIPLPPLAEQRRIAEILDRAEALRAKRRAALAELDALPQSLFLELFGDPVTNQKKWPQKAMKELFAASPIFGTMIPPRIDGGSWMSLRVANIQDWQLDLSDQKFVTLPANTIDRHSVRNGDMLMARAIASQEHLGKAVVVYPNDQKWAFDSHLMRLRFDSAKALPEFIRSLLMTKGGRALFLKASRRSAVQYNINTKEMAALRVPLPPLPLQQEFARQVGAIEKLKGRHQAALRELDALFATLQHRAFRGEL